MLLTLVRIRRGYDIRHISYLFGITQSLASKIFPSCKFLALMFKPLLLWPSKELVRENLPDSFKNYPRTRVIIDATEFKIEKPSRPVAQKQIWSNYKHANTVKLLVGIMPSGAITLISKVYSRCISDMHITEISGLLELLNEMMMSWLTVALTLTIHCRDESAPLTSQHSAMEKVWAKKLWQNHEGLPLSGFR